MNYRKLFIPVVAAAFAVALVSCSEIGTDSSVPVYEGMTIQKQVPTVRSLKKASQDFTPNDGVSRPEHNETIENEVDDLIDIEVATDDEVRYYVQPNTSFIVEVHLKNPSQYEIQSFTLNGKKYANYMFEEGSDLETLRLEVPSIADSGYHSYSIDAIKYIDGEAIKDVDMSKGDKSIFVGVSYSSRPTAEILDSSIDSTMAKFTIDVKDPENVLTNAVSLYLSDGYKIIKEQELHIGINNIEFDNLVMNQKYQFGIGTAYDFIDGKDVHEEWLLKQEFTTPGAFKFDNVQVGKRVISFRVVPTSYTGEVTKITLYDATTEQVVETKGADATSFGNLLSDHSYYLIADYTYYLGQEPRTDWCHTDVLHTKAMVAPSIDLSYIDASKTSIEYSVDFVDEDGIGSVSSVELVRDGAVVDSHPGLTEGRFDNLLSDSDYEVIANYTYDLNDGSGPRSGSVSKAVSTKAMVEPRVDISYLDSTKTSIAYDVEFSDVDGIGEVSSVQLLLGDKVVNTSSNFSEGQFTDLLSNNLYTLKVGYTYDLNDGSGLKTGYVEKDISTKAKVVPTLDLDDISITSTTIDGELIIVDEDEVAFIKSVSIYQDGQKIADNLEGEVSFAGLESYTAYEVVVDYAYDLNDGAGERLDTLTYDFKTNPEVEVLKTSVSNTGAVSEGDTIYMQLELDNPSKAWPEYVVVNGEQYKCVEGSGYDNVYVEILNQGQFEGGLTELNVEGVVMGIDGLTFTAQVPSGMSGSVFVNGRLNLESVQFVDDEQNPVEYFHLGEKVNILLSLANKTGYEIYDVKVIGGTQIDHESLTKIDDERWVYSFNLSYSGLDTPIEITSISYRNADVDITKQIEGQTLRLYVAENQIDIPVSNIEELKSIATTEYSNKSYVLTNDLDFAGVDWNPIDFQGIFNGGGHTVKNLSIVKTYTNSDASVGLFGSVNGLLTNLTMEDVNIIASFDFASSSTGGTPSVGALAASCNQASNINVTGGLVSARKVNEDLAIGFPIGGVVGSCSYVKKCTNSANVSTNIGQANVGGIVGTSNDIGGCINRGSIYASTGRIGGLAGNCNSLNRSSNYGDMHIDQNIGYAYIGGLVGEINNNSSLYDIHNYGNIRVDTTSKGTSYCDLWIGGLFGALYLNRSSSILDSTNSGDITIKVSSTNINLYLGGIVGYLVGGGYSLSMINASNSGNISLQKAATANSYGNIGLFIGCAYGTVVTSNCRNSGNIESNFRIDADIFCGYGDASVTHDNFVNTGTISMPSKY